MKILYIHVVHTPTLEERKRYFSGTIEYIKSVGEKYNYSIRINMVTEPNVDYIDANIDAFNKRVNYDKEEDEEFNKTIQKLNAPQISNTEKHRMIYENIKHISELPIKQDKDLHLVIEDDVVVSQEYTKNFEELIENIEKLDKWDILFTCISNKNDTLSDIATIDSRENFKMLLCKSSYIIKPQLAIKLNEYLKTFKYTLKNAISKYIWDNKDVKSYILNRHIFLEGSKLGLLLSSTNNNNILFQNNDFIHLARIASMEEIDDKLLKKALEIYSRIENLKSADVLHTMGILYYKVKDFEKSKRMLSESVMLMKKNNGYLTNTSEILNNCINMYQYEQDDLEDCMKIKGKYDIELK